MFVAFILQIKTLLVRYRYCLNVTFKNPVMETHVRVMALALPKCTKIPPFIIANVTVTGPAYFVKHHYVNEIHVVIVVFAVWIPLRIHSTVIAIQGLRGKLVPISLKSVNETIHVVIVEGAV